MRPSWVEVDLDAIAHNVSALTSLVAPARLCAVVKADAYAHGDVPVAETALAAGAPWLAVALLEEGIRLREAGIDGPVLVLAETSSADAPEMIHWRLTPTVYRHSFVDALEQATQASSLAPAVHVKLDTGMHRVGAEATTVIELAERLARGSPLRLGGVWTHFAVAEQDPEFTARQIDEFDAVIGELMARGIDPGIRHLANTPGAILHPASRADMARVGLGIYGLYPSKECRRHVDLRPAMRVVSHVSYIRRHPAGTRLSYGRHRPLEAESTVATVPIGYADGVPRLLSRRGGRVLIGGRSHPMAGAVTMDQLVVDVGHAEVEVGDEVVLIGAQGDEEITADEWAEKTETISYEIVARIGPRLPREHRMGG